MCVPCANNVYTGVQRAFRRGVPCVFLVLIMYIQGCNELLGGRVPCVFLVLIMYIQECNELLGGGYKYLDVRCPDEIAQGAPYDSVFLVCSLCVPSLNPKP